MQNKADRDFIKKEITGYFTEFKPILTAQRAAKKELRKVNKKLLSFEKKYQYLIDLVSQGADDDFLATKVKLLLKEAGFSKVNHYTKKVPKREDLQAYHDNDLFIIEVKGLGTGNPKRTDLIQIAPYYNTTKVRQPLKNVYGLNIISHEKNIPIDRRGKRFFSQEIHEDLISYNCGTISMRGLLIIFKKLKTDKITFEDFKNTLKKTGYINY